MPVGTGIQTASLLPSVPHVIDPTAFAAGTEPQEVPLVSIPAPGPGNRVNYDLPNADIVSALTITATGTLEVTAAASGQTQPVPADVWPYGLLDGYTLSVNGISEDIWAVDGMDLRALSFVERGGETNNPDVFPGAEGGGGSALAAGSYPIHLSWPVQIAASRSALVAAIFLNSTQALASGKLSQAPMADLVAPGGTSTLWSFANLQFTVQETAWTIPYNDKGEMILPDIRRLHMVIATERPWTNTGEVPLALLRTEGQLMRLFTSGYSATNVALSALPGTPDANKIDKWMLRYGAKSEPFTFDPASVLAARNGRDYHSVVPGGRLVLDLMRSNPARDMVLLGGVTNLRVAQWIDSQVVPTVGQATMRALEEVLV